jgi:hypothetical protein
MVLPECGISDSAAIFEAAWDKAIFSNLSSQHRLADRVRRCESDVYSNRSGN